MSEKREEITITFVGSKKFKQQVVDLVYDALMEDDIQFAKNGDGLTFTSSIEPKGSER